MHNLTAGAIIVRKRNGLVQVLLTRRNVEPFKEQWCLPGGHVDPGESPEDAVVREVREEIGLDFKGALFREVDEVIPEMGINNRVFFFEGSAEGILHLDPIEVLEARWFSLREAAALPLAFYHNEVLKVWESTKLRGR